MASSLKRSDGTFGHGDYFPEIFSHTVADAASGFSVIGKIELGSHVQIIHKLHRPTNPIAPTFKEGTEDKT